MSSKCSSTCSYLTNKKPVWTPQGHANDVLKLIVCQSYLSVATIFEHRMDVQKMSSKRPSTSPYLTDKKPVWTPHGRPKDVLKMIVYLFLFDWHNICLNTPWMSKWCRQSDPLQVPIWVSQPYLNTPWTCNRCPQIDRLPVPIWLTQHLFEHPMNVQKMSSKWSSTSSYLSVLTLFEHPMDVQDMSSKWSSTSSYWLTQHLFEHPMNVQKMSSKWSSTSSYLSVLTLFEHPMDVQDMSSKWSSTSSYLTGTKPVWTPHGRPKYVLKMIVYLFLFGWTNPVWTTKDRLPVPIWTPHERPKDVIKVILYKFLFECPNPIWTPHGRAKYVLKVIVYQFLFDWHNICLNTPWTCKICPQSDRLPVPIWLTQPCLNTPWTKDVLKMIVYLFLFDWHNLFDVKRCPQRDRLPVQHLFEHPMDVQMMSSKGSSTSSYLTVQNLVWTPHGRPKDVLKMIVYLFLFDWHHLFEHPMERPKDVL